MQPCDLAPDEKEALVAALVSAFPRFDGLKSLTSFKLGEKLDAISPPAALPALALNIVEWAEAHNRIDALVRGAVALVPGNVRLQAFLRAYLASAQRSITRSDLERIIDRQRGVFDVVDWRERLERVERQVCRIELGRARALGSGILVAPDIVLTAAHVIKGHDLGRIQVRFGLRQLDGEDLDEGTVFLLHPEGALACPALHDTAHSALAEQLDMALLRLADRAGDHWVDARLRGYARPAADLGLQPGRLVFIVQHPQGQPMKVAFDDVVGVAGDGRYVYYPVNTEPGSSGAPVFNQAWELVALHLGAVPPEPPASEPSCNRGLPLRALIAALDEASRRQLGW